jgi:hypothetical protein
MNASRQISIGGDKPSAPWPHLEQARSIGQAGPRSASLLLPKRRRRLGVEISTCYDTRGRCIVSWVLTNLGDPVAPGPELSHGLGALVKVVSLCEVDLSPTSV